MQSRLDMLLEWERLKPKDYGDLMMEIKATSLLSVDNQTIWEIKIDTLLGYNEKREGQIWHCFNAK